MVVPHRPWALRNVATNELSELAMVNLHVLEPRLRPEFHSHIRSLENVICELTARIGELNQEMDEGLTPQGGWAARIR